MSRASIQSGIGDTLTNETGKDETLMELTSDCTSGASGQCASTQTHKDGVACSRCNKEAEKPNTIERVKVDVSGGGGT